MLNIVQINTQQLTTMVLVHTGGCSLTSTVDSNEVRMTGENSYLNLGQVEGGEFTTLANHWRVLYSPAGPGHALFLKSELTNDEVAVYSDNPALAQWLQGEIEVFINPPFTDTSIPVTEAEFDRIGDVRSYITERVTGTHADISLTWWDILEPMAIDSPPGTDGSSHGVYTIIIPARKAQLVLNGKFASGKPLREDQDGREATSTGLAWSETWVRPR